MQPILGQLASDDRVVAGIDHDVEAVPDQHFGGLEGLDHIGKQRLLIGQHFQLDQFVAVEELTGQAAGTHCVLGGETAGGVRQDGVALGADHIGRSRPWPILVRRTATVTISAPEASIATRVSSRSLYLPVPTRRD